MVLDFLAQLRYRGAMKNIAILGSTGSIGTQTLEIVDRFPDLFNIISLVTNRNVQLLKYQIEKFKPEFVVVSDKKKCTNPVKTS